MDNTYRELDYLIRTHVREPERSACLDILARIKEEAPRAPGSSHNHQAWPGGYLDHITEICNIAVQLYRTMDDLRLLPFTLHDAVLVLFLHDLEKPWRYEVKPYGTIVARPGLRSRKQKAEFRERILREHGIALTPEQHNAFTYVEGEHDDYSSDRRVMNPLAAFCHMCDVASARIWHDRPTVTGKETWAPSQALSIRNRSGSEPDKEPEPT